MKRLHKRRKSHDQTVHYSGMQAGDLVVLPEQFFQKTDGSLHVKGIGQIVTRLAQSLPEHGLPVPNNLADPEAGSVVNHPSFVV